MFRRANPVKNQEDLQYDVFCLKQKLIVTLEENKLLKVKVRKLQSEIVKKDKRMELLINPKKNEDIRKLICDQGGNIILNLQKRVKHLEEILLQKELQFQKYCNEMKTACLYCHRPSYKDKRKEPKTRSPANANHLTSITTVSLPSRVSSVTKYTSKRTEFLESTLDSANVNKERLTKERSSKRTKQSQGRNKISLVSKTYSQLLVPKKLNEFSKCKKKQSSTHDHGMLNFDKENISRLTAKQTEADDNRRPRMLEIVPELYEQSNDDFTFENSIRPSVTIGSAGEVSSHGYNNKTKIEYALDSEVSSDGEDLYIPGSDFFEPRIRRP